jgi:cell wall hydrolase
VISGDDLRLGRDYIVACVVATEVPPTPTAAFTAEMIPLALRAVCDVIRNRAQDPAFPKTAVEVVLQPNQFSAVCRQDYWRRAMAGTWFPQHVAAALVAWREVLSPVLPAGVCWYYSPVSMEPVDTAPAWIAGKEEVVVDGLSREYFRFCREAA